MTTSQNLLSSRWLCPLQPSCSQCLCSGRPSASCWAQSCCASTWTWTKLVSVMTASFRGIAKVILQSGCGEKVLTDVPLQELRRSWDTAIPAGWGPGGWACSSPPAASCSPPSLTSSSLAECLQRTMQVKHTEPCLRTTRCTAAMTTATYWLHISIAFYCFGFSSS